jgi:acetate kinase
MKILVINTGSSSIKYKLFDMAHHKELASGLAEKIGEVTSILSHKISAKNKKALTRVKEGPIADHHEGLTQIGGLLVHSEYGVILDKSEISAVGHRVVHGGEAFQSSTIIDNELLAITGQKLL